jgi:hypothetical protein
VVVPLTANETWRLAAATCCDDPEALAPLAPLAPLEAELLQAVTLALSAAVRATR